jgi:nicotinamidase-related amidase
MSFNYIPTKQVEVPDIQYKDEVSLAPKNTAVVVVDMQNDFVMTGGNLVVESAMATVPRIERLLAQARKSGVRIVYTQDTGIEGDPEWEIWPQHCRINSWGWQIIDDLKPQSDDLICTKNRYDGFYGTWLEHFLSYVWNIKNLVIVGTVSNICVLHTAASAGLRWYRVVIPADGISALTEFDQALTLRQVSSLYSGDVVQSVDQINFSNK